MPPLSANIASGTPRIDIDDLFLTKSNNKKGHCKGKRNPKPLQCKYKETFFLSKP
jgi:hypothetical protein